MNFKEYRITVKKIISIIKKCKLENPEIVGMLEMIKMDYMLNYGNPTPIMIDKKFGYEYRKVKKNVKFK
jgi:hypothetical protein